MAVLRQYLSVIAVAQLLIEAAWFAAALVLAVGLQRHGRGFSDLVLAPALVFAALLVAANGLAGLYRGDGRTPIGHFLWRTAGALAMGSAFAYVAFYLIPGGRNVQEVLLDAAVIAFVGFVLLRKGVFARTDALTARVLVIGAGDEAVELENAIEGLRHGRPEIVGFYAVPGRDTFVPVGRVISNGETLSAAVRRLRVSEIIVAVRDQRGGGVPMDELLKCRLAGVPVRALEGFYELLRGRVPVESLKASWLIYGDGFRQNWWRVFEKRLIDIVASLVLLAVFLPVMVLVAIAIVLESGFPILYRQERVGRGGRTLMIWKFRSMRQDAEADGKACWAQADDPRCTRVGRFIRKLRIDELPQLFNVLIGDLSLVGPRPERPEFVSRLASEIPFYDARHSVNPGITGWAQVRYAYGASTEDAKRKLEYDLYYVKNHTLFLDVLILLETIRVVLRGEGAR
jgi:sugar transferase (PEP-CTERM system associated)